MRMRKPSTMWAARLAAPLAAAGAAAGLWLVAASIALAAFELEALGPAERGSATRLALGVFEERRGSADSSASRPVALAAYGFRPFGVCGIDFAAVSARLPVGRPADSVELAYRRLAAPAYLEQTYLVSATIGAGGAVVEPAVRLGTVAADGTFADWVILADISAGAAVSPDIRVAVEADNPLGLGLVREGSRCPRRLCLGLGVRVSKSLSLGLEAAKTGGERTCFRSGVEWATTGALAVRVGLGTCPEEFAFGVGLRLGRIVFDAATSVNLDLGVTHEAGLTVLWK